MKRHYVLKEDPGNSQMDRPENFKITIHQIMQNASQNWAKHNLIRINIIDLGVAMIVSMVAIIKVARMAPHLGTTTSGIRLTNGSTRQ